MLHVISTGKSLPLHCSLIGATLGSDSERDCKRTSMPPMNLPSLFVRRGFFIYLQTNKGMVSVKFTMEQIYALKTLLSMLCNERRVELENTRAMRQFYSKAELSDIQYDEWLSADRDRLREVVELYELAVLACERV